MKSQLDRILSQALSVLLISVVLCTLIFVLRAASQGFDFSDESYYLIWISNPWDFSYSLSQFGFVYHPIYKIFPSVQYLRIFNVLSLFGLSSIFGWLLYNGKLPNERVFEVHKLTLQSLAFSLSIGVSALLFFHLWILTPSYNSLNMIGLIAVGSGILLISLYGRNHSGWSVISVGGVVLFLAKPSTAALAGIICLIYALLIRPRRRIIFACLVMILVLVLFAILYIDGSVASFVSRLYDGYNIGKTLSGGGGVGSGIFNLGTLNLSVYDKVSLVLFFLFGYLVSWLREKAKLLSIILTALTLFYCLVLLSGLSSPPVINNLYLGYHVWSAALGVLLYKSIQLRFDLLNRKLISIASIFLLFPYFYAFGSANNYIFMYCHLSVFFISGLCLLLKQNRKDFFAEILPFFSIMLVVVISGIIYGVRHPYRQASDLSKNIYKTEVLDSSFLFLDEQAKRYIAELREIGLKNDLKPRQGIIDFTGRYPGSVLVLNGMNVGHVWLLGGYSGSSAFFINNMDRVPCSELVSSWLIVEVGGPRGIPTDLLGRYGLNVDLDFDMVGSLLSVPGDYPEQYVQKIYRPRAEGIFNASSRCQNLRHIK